ncbi:hypothetical protein KC865_02155 [Candidatus Kaiserbacteria bacterium]|nr:hypothetical protein [Candidatus Kaiserbacteria bacterium]USN92682.1 MAG: hypothetical protein H6782_02620 [Candidatus Nomurabacteria bacterium]
MKKLLILPGNSKLNEIWGEACARFFHKDFAYIYLMRYEHWITEGPINIPLEIEKIANTVKDGEADDEWYVCAKSIGSIVTLLATKEKAIEPKKCIFFGMPLDIADEEAFNDDWSPLSDFSVPMLVFHNDEDPVASNEFTKTKLEEMGQNVKFIQLSGTDHTYRDFSSYQMEIDKFLK